MTLSDQQINKIIDQGIVCIGCGSKLQTKNKEEAGYIDEKKLHQYLFELKTPDDDINLLCERCFKLRHYNEIEAIEVDTKHFWKMMDHISKENALIIYLLDLFDIEGSFLDQFSQIAAKNPLVLVGNKLDILPKSVKENKIILWLKEMAAQRGLNPLKTIVLSADKGNSGEFLIDEISDLLNSYKRTYIIGVTNVGKSTLTNQIVKYLSGGRGDFITTSKFPGTTLDRIEIPISEKNVLVDTPGVTSDKQLAYFVDSKEYRYLLPKKEIKPRTFQMPAGQSLFFGGIFWIDLLGENKTSFTAYFDNQVNFHRRKTEGALDYFNSESSRQAHPMLKDNNYKLTVQKLKIPKGYDLAISGFGWISFHRSAEIKLNIPDQLGFSLRKKEI
ncbi:ribosome biogenesis GTPase YqeH [Oenococcus alcoholitolerans]|uniref:ribosome biogenesis GTPase YqeH n=1 Tax=Oenococcus alcoholitolerans TaxID=931074 RepID=UPI003F71DBB7